MNACPPAQVGALRPNAVSQGPARPCSPSRFPVPLSWGTDLHVLERPPYPPTLTQDSSLTPNHVHLCLPLRKGEPLPLGVAERVPAPSAEPCRHNRQSAMPCGWGGGPGCGLAPSEGVSEAPRDTWLGVARAVCGSSGMCQATCGASTPLLIRCCDHSVVWLSGDSQSWRSPCRRARPPGSLFCGRETEARRGWAPCSHGTGCGSKPGTLSTAWGCSLTL